MSTDDLIEQAPEQVADILIAAVAGAGYAAGSMELFHAGPARATQSHHVTYGTLLNHLRRFKFAREQAERPRAHRCGRPTRSGTACQQWTLAHACWRHDGMLPDKAVQTTDGELVDLGRRSGWVLLPRGWHYFPKSDAAPRVTWLPAVGLHTLGGTARGARQAANRYRQARRRQERNRAVLGWAFGVPCR